MEDSFFGGPDCLEVDLGHFLVVKVAALEFFGRLGSGELLGSELPVADVVIRESVLLEYGEIYGEVIVCDVKLKGFVPLGRLVSAHVSGGTYGRNDFLVCIRLSDLYIGIHLSGHVGVDGDLSVLASKLKGSLFDESALRGLQGLGICGFLDCGGLSVGLILQFLGLNSSSCSLILGFFGSGSLCLQFLLFSGFLSSVGFGLSKSLSISLLFSLSDLFGGLLTLDACALSICGSDAINECGIVEL